MLWRRGGRERRPLLPLLDNLRGFGRGQLKVRRRSRSKLRGQGLEHLGLVTVLHVAARKRTMGTADVGRC